MKTITLKVLTNVSTWETLPNPLNGLPRRLEGVLLGAGEHIVVPLSEYNSESPSMLVKTKHDFPVSILKSNTIVIK